MARHLNDRVALELLARHGPMTRTQLREAMGVGQPTAIEIARRLELAGSIAAIGPARPTRPGPRAILYGLVPATAFVAGARVRDGKIAAALNDVAGGPALGLVDLDMDATPLPQQIAAAVRSAMTSARVKESAVQRVVVGVPGVVERPTGDLGFTWDLTAWRGRLLGPLQARIAAPVELVNGVNLAAIAESHQPDGTDRATFALLWIGQGVGASLLIDGVPFSGGSGGAGQVGYMPIPGSPVTPVLPEDGPFPGDLQGLVGAAALRGLAQERGLPSDSLPALVRRAAQSHDADLCAFLDEVARRIATGLAAITAVIDPGVVVLQGETGVAGGDVLAQRVEQHLSSVSPLGARVRASTLADVDAEVLGALLHARDGLRDELWGGITDDANAVLREIRLSVAL